MKPDRAIVAGRTTLRQHEDGSIHAVLNKAGPGGQVAAAIVIDAAQLERWLVRLMRAELLPSSETLTVAE